MFNFAAFSSLNGCNLLVILLARWMVCNLIYHLPLGFLGCLLLKEDAVIILCAFVLSSILFASLLFLGGVVFFFLNIVVLFPITCSIQVLLDVNCDFKVEKIIFLVPALIVKYGIIIICHVTFCSSLCLLVLCNLIKVPSL